MAVTTAGISTLGVKLGYAVANGIEDSDKPTSFEWLERCNSISGIELSTENIDASALEDASSRYVAGRQDSGGQWSVVFNLTSEVEAQLVKMTNAYKAIRSDNTKCMWFEVWSPNMDKAFFVVAQPPLEIPMPEVAQNELQTVSMTFTVVKYVGTLAGVEPTEAA